MSRADTPLCSVVIPTYNRAPRLASSLASARRAGLRGCELLVVDDGSIDDTAALMATFPDVTYIPRANGGASAARNTGMAQCRGRYVAFLDDDDEFLPNAHQRMVDACEGAPHVDVVFGDVLVNDRQDTYERGMRRPVYDPVRAARRREIAPGIWELDRRLFTDFLLFERNCVLLQAAVIRKTAVQRAGGLNERLSGYEEWEFFTRLSAAGTFAYYDAPVTRVEKHGGNMSQDLERMVGNAVIIRAGFLGERYAADAPRRARLRELWRDTWRAWALMAFQRGDGLEARRRLESYAAEFGVDWTTRAYLAATRLPRPLVTSVRALKNSMRGGTPRPAR